MFPHSNATASPKNPVKVCIARCPPCCRFSRSPWNDSLDPICWVHMLDLKIRNSCSIHGHRLVEKAVDVAERLADRGMRQTQRRTAWCDAICPCPSQGPRKMDACVASHRTGSFPRLDNLWMGMHELTRRILMLGPRVVDRREQACGSERV